MISSARLEFPALCGTDLANPTANAIEGRRAESRGWAVTLNPSISTLDLLI